MNELLAIEIARLKMQELGFGNNYTIRVRHLHLLSGQIREIKSGNDVLIFYNLGTFMRIESKAGIFDTTFPQSNEMQYVHSGIVTLTNLHEFSPVDFLFLQIIPFIKK